MKKIKSLLPLLMTLVMMAMNHTSLYAQDIAGTLSIGDNTIAAPESTVRYAFTPQETKDYLFTASESAPQASAAIFENMNSLGQAVKSGQMPLIQELKKGVTYYINFRNYSSDFTLNLVEAPIVAQVTIGSETTGYMYMEEALAAAQNGTQSSPATVKLRANSSKGFGENAYTVTAGVMTIDLNGYRMEGFGCNNVLTVRGADVTIEDNSLSKSGFLGGTGANHALNFESGKLLVKDGTFQTSDYGLFNSNGFKQGEVTLHGGTFLSGIFRYCIYIPSSCWGLLGMEDYYFMDVTTGAKVIPNANVPVLEGSVTVVPIVCPHTAARTHTAAVEATTEALGNIEYWTCKVCGALLDAATGGNVLTASGVVTHFICKGEHKDEDNDFRCDVCHDVLLEEPVLVTAENCEALGLDAKYIGYKAISNLAQLAGFAMELDAPMTFAAPMPVDAGQTDNTGNTGIIQEPKSPRKAQAKATCRKEAELTAEEPNYKYVLTTDIVVNKDLLDEDGMPQENDKNGNFRTDLLHWNNPDFCFEEKSGKSIPAVFDGNGHTISGLYQNEAVYYFDGDCASGFLRNMSELSTVCNLGITDSYFSTGTAEKDIIAIRIGSIAADTKGVIDNCWSDATISVEKGVRAFCGGLAGSTYASAVIKNSHYDGVMRTVNNNSEDAYGGIVGKAYIYKGCESSISGCHFSGKFINDNVSDDDIYFGGIVGLTTIWSDGDEIMQLAIDRCYADGSVINNNMMYIAGIVGEMEYCGGGYAAITNCYNAMEVTNGNAKAYYRLYGFVCDAYGENDSGVGNLWIDCCFVYCNYETARSYAPLYDECYNVDVYADHNFCLESSENVDGPDCVRRKVIQLGDNFTLPQALPADAFACGYVAYYLNYFNNLSSGPKAVSRRVEEANDETAGTPSEEDAAVLTSVWFQEIGVDKYPVLKGDKYTVVYRDQDTFYNLQRTLEEYALTDGMEYDFEKDTEVAEFTYTRNFEGTNWTTWYVPFDLELTEDFCKAYSFTRINNVHQYDDDGDGEADRSVIESFRQKAPLTLKANYPYLVKARTDEALTMTIQLDDVMLHAAAENSIDCQSIDNDYVFKGTYKTISHEEADMNQYSIFDDDPDDGIYGWEHFCTLAPQRHYLTITSRYGNAPMKVSRRRVVMKVMGDEDATGVVNLYTEEQQQAETYDLTGRRIPADSQQPGIRITNGKKVMVK